MRSSCLSKEGAEAERVPQIPSIRVKCSAMASRPPKYQLNLTSTSRLVVRWTRSWSWAKRILCRGGGRHGSVMWRWTSRAATSLKPFFPVSSIIVWLFGHALKYKIHLWASKMRLRPKSKISRLTCITPKLTTNHSNYDCNNQLDFVRRNWDATLTANATTPIESNELVIGRLFIFFFRAWPALHDSASTDSASTDSASTDSASTDAASTDAASTDAASTESA